MAGLQSFLTICTKEAYPTATFAAYGSGHRDGRRLVLPFRRRLLRSVGRQGEASASTARVRAYGTLTTLRDGRSEIVLGERFNRIEIYRR
jgi:hypothetical protein